MDLFSSTYPVSAFVLLFLFIFGFIICSLFFGFISLSICILLIYLGSLRIIPIINFCRNTLTYIFPNCMNKLNKNINKSFPILYSNRFKFNKRYIYCFHPHGLFCLSYYLNIGTNLTDWLDKNVKGTASYLLWYLPFGKEILEKAGFVQSNYKDMKAVLEENKSLSVALGGIKEILYTRDNILKLNIANKKGIFKMALETGTPIVPVIAYGENENFKIYDSYITNCINNFLIQFKVCMPLPTMESFINWISLFYKPLNIPIQTYIGEPLSVNMKNNPTDKDIEDLRTQYFSRLTTLYNNTRPNSYDKNIYIV